MRRYRELFFYSYLELNNTKNKLDISVPDRLMTRTDYSKLFFLLNAENENNEVLGGTRVLYKGFRSDHGYDRDGIEGTTRFLPYLVSYILTLNEEDKEYNILVNRYNRIITNGIFDKKLNWGKAVDYDQLICEAADIALSLWLSKGFYWDHINKNDRDIIASWLTSFLKLKIPSNNWYLFILTIEFVLKDFGYLQIINQRYFDKIKTFYFDCGWFRDGENGEIDLYSIYSFHYSLYWISQIDPLYEKQFINDAISSIYSTYGYLFNDATYFEPFGRSQCYRMAIAIPIATSCQKIHDESHLKKCSYIISKIYEHFIKLGAIKKGRITQGVYVDNQSTLDIYSGPASPLWCLRPLIICNYLISRGVDLFPDENKALDFVPSGMLDFFKLESNVEKIKFVEEIKHNIEYKKKSNILKRMFKLLVYLEPLR
jgi:hypothetical protein